MKRNFTIILLLLAGVTAIYTSCHKNNEAAPVNTVDSKTVSVQVAQSLATIFTSSYGGFNFDEGLDFPTTLSINPKGRLSINAVNQSPVCGAKLDTTLQENISDNNSALSIWTKIKYAVTCTNGKASGVTIYDSLNVSGTASSYKLAVKQGQNLVLTSLNPGVYHSKYTFDGAVNSSVSYIPTTAGQQSIVGTFNYSFKSVVVDPANNADILSGSASFSTTGTTGKNTWNYSGTIVFLGNHKAKITINGTVYTADLTTGQVV